MPIIVKDKNGNSHRFDIYNRKAVNSMNMKKYNHKVRK